MTSFDSEGEPSMQESTPLLDEGSGATNYSDITVSTVSDDKKGIPTEIASNGQSRSGRGRRRPPQSLAVQTQPNRVMTQLAEGENEFSMDYKYILLEDLGTRSSWLILLLPYVAFFICLMLESSTLLSARHTFMVDASHVCSAYPPSPGEAPCHFSFEETDEAGFIHGPALTNGIGFESGIISEIPVIGTYLYGDALFENLSASAVEFVGRGMLEASVVLYQQVLTPSNNKEETWALMFISDKQPVSMACELMSANRWDCTAPRLVNVVFTMPDTAVYAGGDIHMNILYSERKEERNSTSTNATAGLPSVYTSDKGAFGSTLDDVDDAMQIVEQIVASSKYSLEHMSELAMKVDTGIRMLTFSATLVFFFFWLYNMEVTGLFGGFRDNFHYCFPSSKTCKLRFVVQ